MEVTLTQPRTYLEIQLNSENKQLNKSKRKASKPCKHGRTSSNTTCPHLHKRRQEVGDRLTLRNSWWERPTKDPTRTKNQRHTQSQQKPQPKISKIRRSRRLYTKSHRYSTTEVYTKNSGGQNRAPWEAEANRKNLTNNGNTKKQSPNDRKGGSLRNNLNEKEARQLPDIEFKAMVFRKLNKLMWNYQKLQGNYNELTANYINMKKGNRNYQHRPRGNKNTISELKKTEEGIKSRLDEQRTGSANWRTR